MKLVLFVLKLLSLIFLSKEDCDKTIITDFTIDNCIAQRNGVTTYYYTVNDKSCIPYCEAYLPDGYFRKNCPCVPGYVCKKRCSASNDAALVPCVVNDDCLQFPRSSCSNTCVSDSSTCMAYYANTTDYRENKFKAMYFKPGCQNDGFWKAKQCKGGVSGKCICYDRLGVRLFGEAKYSKSEDMTCTCSRKRADLMADGRDYVTFHCNDLGNYEELQCDSGLCWCVEEKTGELTSIVVPEKAMNKLPCYEVAKVGSQYLRQCDSIIYANAKIERTLKNHGVTYINLGIRLCDGDGAYGVYNVSDGLAYCTWRDGSKIKAYQSDSGTNINTLTCRCARDVVIYNHALTCEGNGNYRSYQTVIQDSADYYYCVDNDGFQKSGLVSLVPECGDYY